MMCNLSCMHDAACGACTVSNMGCIHSVPHEVHVVRSIRCMQCTAWGSCTVCVSEALQLQKAMQQLTACPWVSRVCGC